VETLVYIALLNIVIFSFWGAYQFYLDQTNRINKESNKNYSNRKIDQSPLLIILSDQSISPGSTMNLNTFGGSGPGNVIYSTTSQNICSINGVVLTALSSGTCMLLATKSSSPRFNEIKATTSLMIDQ
jgi:hypothetical protein